MIAAMDARPALVSAMGQELEAELDWFDQHLAGRGTSSATGSVVRTSPKATLPQAVEDALARWSARPSLRWVERTYTEHRH